MAFRVIQGALSVIVTQIRTLASLASEVDRLHFLLVCMESMVPDVRCCCAARVCSGLSKGDGDEALLLLRLSMRWVGRWPSRVVRGGV